MQKSHLGVTFVVLFVMLVLMSAPSHINASTGSSAVPPAPVLSHSAAATPLAVTHASPALVAGFPRTVLIETFTGVWCPHCPAETQALHALDGLFNQSVLNIPELHVCEFATGTGPCGDNFVPTDGTSVTRGTFYNVCGFPDVFFDGNNPSCGATNSASQMETQYNLSISHAQSYPGNVSISQSAVVSSGYVTDHATIDSGLTGTYNAITYLLELIDKTNVNTGSGPHDLDRVVRSTLFNGPVTLAAGSATDISSRGAINSTWNQLNFTVVTFVQQNSTKIVENTNEAPVTTLTTAVASNVTSLLSRASATVTIHVANSSTGASLAGAAVNLTWNGGGTMTPSAGLTDGNGDFVGTYVAPTVTSATTVVVTAHVTATGYTSGTGTTTILVNPLVAPLVPVGLTIAPGNGQVQLNWTAPGSGGGGVTYHLYRAASHSGPYVEISAASSTSFVDAGLTGGQTYWYQVSAENTGGFSPNTTAVGATGLTVLTQGLPPYVGYWLSIDSTNFSSSTNASLPLYLPYGFFAYEFGPHSYAYLPTEVSTPLTVSGTPLTVTISFTPRYAGLQGTVSPADASVTINGTAVVVADGSFVDSLVAGTYMLNVTAPGYQYNVSSVILTPGNITHLAVIQLQAAPSNSGSSAASTLTGEDELVLAVGLIGVVAVVGGAVLLSSGGKRGRKPRTGTQ